eukprot:gnl/MRDRNA2_/MRDRNA2_67441_c0_seq1.p1 gnl/MRDRNA2_/MRDRNA2_67441_c0~~gnl/MRDRNA2_/MRDRNA2_67441_c0_seq1.p1  ORF type:complete len:433 (+),score=86.97 gnl/MRDRNA2_/MRDRNA2_67441_c0_seq1:180-1301(+)
MSPLWVIGFATWLAAQIINFVAMAMAPQVVLSCLGLWSLVCNMVFAHLILGETILRDQALVMLCLMVSVAIVIVNAPQPTAEKVKRGGDVETLAADFLHPDFQLLTACFLGGILALWCLAVGSRWIFRRSSGDGSDGENREAWEGYVGDLQPIAWAASSAAATGYTALLFKCIAQVLISTADTDENMVSQKVASPWTLWQTYAILVSAMVLAPTEVHLLNMALKCGDALLVVPMYFALGMLAQLLTGAVFFQEFKDFQSQWQANFFVTGVVLALLCIIMMARVQQSQVDPESCSESSDSVGNRGKAFSLPEPLQEDLLAEPSDSPGRRQSPVASPCTNNAPLLQLGGVDAWAPFSPAARRSPSNNLTADGKAT